MVKVSVIIPVFNVEKYLKECIESISNQSLEDIEIICIDDGSSDDSLNILNEYANKDSRFKILHQDNLGPGAARNYGVNESSSPWICFLDADDWWELTFLEEMAGLIDELGAAWKEMGCAIESPSMTMSFIPLACLPELRLTNRGLVDCKAFQFVDLFLA